MQKYSMMLLSLQRPTRLRDIGLVSYSLQKRLGQKADLRHESQDWLANSSWKSFHLEELGVIISGRNSKTYFLWYLPTFSKYIGKRLTPTIKYDLNVFLQRHPTCGILLKQYTILNGGCYFLLMTLIENLVRVKVNIWQLASNNCSGFSPGTENPQELLFHVC